MSTLLLHEPKYNKLTKNVGLDVEAEMKQERKAYEEEHASNIVEIYALGHHTRSIRRGEAACDTVENTAPDTGIFLCATGHDMALSADRIYQLWKLF